MSVRTIFEINHDRTFAIDDHPLEFAAAMKAYLCSGDMATAAALERYGLRRVWSGHHSDYRAVETNSELIEL